ncbi:MAG: glycosyltransferase family 4 protein [Cyanobacteria bacterium J06623_7]
MKTLQIGLEWFPERGGGLDRYFYDCVQQLPLAGIDVKGLVAGSERAAQDTQGQVTAFAPADSGLINRLTAVRQEFKQVISESDYDLVVSHFALYTFPLLNLLGNRPLVTHFHGPWALESDVEANKSLGVKVKKWFEAKTYGRSQQFIVLSQTFRQLLHQEYRVPLERITVIPGAVDLERFNVSESPNLARQKLGWETERPIMFCIRRLAKRMGLENLVVAMQDVCQQYPDALLYIGGKGELAETLQAQISQLGLEENIKLLGYIADDDLPLCYRAANFSLVPTVALEGFGLIVIESLAAGTPVLGTPVGGIPEILRPFNSDLVLASSQPQDLASGIIEALGGQRQLPDAATCLAYVRHNYTWSVIAPQIETVYRRAISEKNQP